MRQTFDPTLLKQAGERQAEALQAGRSVWISANAGTGKTEVLTRRMLALLLSDMSLEPRQLLALTFTKAGAAEMAARLPARLAEWALLEDGKLTERMREEAGVTATPELLARVRELAESVRQAPPMVATIHGLAQQVLGRFAVEAGLPLEFEVLEDGAQKRLLRKVQRGLLVEVEGPLAQYLGTLLDELGEHGWEELTSLVVNSWPKLEVLVRGDGLAGVLGRLERELNVDTGGASARPLVPGENEWAALRRVMGALPDRDDVRAVLHAPAATVESAWRAMLLTDKDTARRKLFTKAEMAVVDEGDAILLADAAARAEAQVRARRVYRGFDVTRAALLWAAAVRGAYVQRKQAMGWVDYGDLLDGLERVMKDSDNGLAEWVWYGLDRRFRHLVVDEAQDNNPQQDRIVRWLAQSILSGDVGEGAARTVLAVGDMKQSIFRFQGAVPELFVQLREVMRDWAGGLLEVDLTHSFRSGKEVLALVDRVFAAGDAGGIVVGEKAPWPEHRAVAAQRPSRVELWPVVEKTEDVEVVPWSLAPVRAAAGGHGEDIVCLRQVGAWLIERVGKVVMPSTGVPLRWEDVMVVVQRNKIAGLAAGVLRGMGIPVASAGGVVPQAVEDAVACVRVVFNRQDNLALAQVLKGVLGWSDAQLLALAERAGVARREIGEAEVIWADFVEGDDRDWLEGLMAMAWDAPLRVVQRIAREVGGDARVFEGLMQWAEGCGNIRELVDRCELEDLPVVAGSAGVRVLTVHGSKGLQAPLVILPDTMAALGSVGQDKVLWGDGVVLFRQGKNLSGLEDALLEEESARRKADNLRGLYVAMTRAMDWLVVTGFGTLREGTDTWWTRVEQGTGNKEGGNEGIWVSGADFEEAQVQEMMKVARSVPGWVARRVELPMVGEVQSEAQVRGEAVHGLLQGLDVAVDDEARAEAARVREALPWLWAKGARSEMAVGLGGGRVGRIDRLVEHEGEWWVVDFKTGAVPELMPEVYATQVRNYVAALRVTWPERKWRAGIVWTAAARLEEVAVG